MAQDDNRLKGELPQFSRDDWLALVRKTLPGSDVEMELSTTTYDGLTIQPLYTLQDDPGAGHAGIPGGAPFTRGRLTSPAEPPWDVRQLFTEPDIDAANQAIGEDLCQGVTSILLRIAAPEQCGIEVHTADEMKRLLDGADVSSVPVALQAGMRCFEIAEIFLKAANELGADANRMPGALNIDPIGTLAQRGVLDINLERAFAGLARIFEQTADRPATFSIMLADGRPYHNAGATEAQEIACAAATLVAYLRALEPLGVPPETVLERSAVMLAADTDQFLTIAKFRALRHVVWRIAEACGAGNAARALPVAAQTSERMMAGRDVHVNMLRTTIACAAAIQGGADAITVLPFTWLLGLPDAFARRIARNTHAVLRDEAAMGRVSDPAGGSWYVERLTDDLAHKAWQLFQDIESWGGIVTALRESRLQGMIRDAAERRQRDIAVSNLEITGVSAFPDLSEIPVTAAPLPPPEELDDPAITVEPMPLRRLSEPFERLRDAADAYASAKGARPRIFLATLGSVADFTDRATYAQSFFAAGGIETSAAEIYENCEKLAKRFTESKTSLACLCSSDEVYQEHAVHSARALKANGAKHIYLAGRAGEMRQAYKDAGIETFVHRGCDMLDLLRRAHDRLDIVAD